ncbi:MAG TPA: hypothetical protein VGC79_17540, partial [Polyangiaceae bacterium]
MSRRFLGSNPRHWLLLSLLVSVSSLASNVAQAQAPGAPQPAPLPVTGSLADSLKGMAKADYAAAKILYEDGDFQGALQKLKASYEAAKDPRLLWNMAACEKNLRHYAEVARLVDRYLAEGGALVSPQDRAD